MAEAAASTTAIPRRRWRPGVLPGFGPTLAITVTYLSLLVLIPLAALVIKAAGLSWTEFWTTISSPPVVTAASPSGEPPVKGARPVEAENPYRLTAGIPSMSSPAASATPMP